MGSRDTDNGGVRDRLEALLAAYGADPSRWPKNDRELASMLASGHPDISALLEDARAVDNVLARASRPELPAGAAERLAAKVAEVPSNVVSLSGHAKQPSRSRQAAMPGRLAAASALASALAASLALGLYLGASGQGDWLIPPLLAEGSPDYLVAEFDVLDLALLEDDMEQ
jgi:hypothetical protein